MPARRAAILPWRLRGPGGGPNILRDRQALLVERRRPTILALISRHLPKIMERPDHGDLQGTPLIQMPWEDVTTPVLTGVKTHFLTAIAAARHMVPQRSGVILTLSSSAAGLSGRDRRYHLEGGFATACAAIEALSRSLAGELGPQGIRVVCLRPNAIPETWLLEPGGDINASGVKPYMEDGTALGRLPTLGEVANAAVFMVSDRASAITGTIANLTCSSIMD
jgi:3-oxoacyl-[acyl-carrier protein] reductase